MAHTTNYVETFITVSPDSPALVARVPTKAGSIAALQYEMISAEPYGLTSDDVIFGVYARRHGIGAAERAAAREAFFAKGQACMRTSPLVRTHGFGVHHDADGRVALYGVETDQYQAFVADARVAKTVGMRSKRAK